MAALRGGHYINLILDFAVIIGSKSNIWGHKFTLISNHSYLTIRINIVLEKLMETQLEIKENGYLSLFYSLI